MKFTIFASLFSMVSASSFLRGRELQCDSTTCGYDVSAQCGTAGSECVTLFAGQFIDAGTVCAAYDADTDVLTITYATAPGWFLGETHLWVGPEPMPTNRKGNPQIGRFPYTDEFVTDCATGVTTFSYDIASYAASMGFPTCDCTSDTTSVLLEAAAHAALYKCDGDGNVIQTETGWGNGDEITEGGSWATESAYCLTCSCDAGDDEPEVSCETNFAYASSPEGTCFLEYGFKRWGWTIGPLTEGSYSYPVYQGAGQCDITKGGLVATLDVVFAGGVVTLSYSSVDSAYEMTECQWYAGAEALPKDVNGEDTVAPGQYPMVYEADCSTHSATFAVDSATVYVVAHGVTCEA